jgi:uncharacterized protein YbcC (UPF0753/DUF2309 family)
MQTDNLSNQIEAACAKIAPLWPLSHFVAVNPFVGFADRRFAEVAAFNKRIQGANTVLPRDWFRDQYQSGSIGMVDLRAAIANAIPEVVESFEAHDEALTEERVVALLKEPSAEEPLLYQTCAFSAYLDSRAGTNWQFVIREETAKWCAAYDDEGQSSWKFPWKDLSLYEGWKAAAQIDRNPELNGLKDFRKAVKAFPEAPEQAIAEAVELLEMPASHVEELLYRILLTLPGWAGHLRYKDREHEIRGGSGSLLQQLLAILLNYEIALYHMHQQDEDFLLGWRRNLLEDPKSHETAVIDFDLAQRLLWQSALEHAFELSLRGHVRPGSIDADRPDVQAVFCIDVRSEVYRRALESTTLKVQTMGFAGFFGLPIDHSVPGLGPSQARCPVLLAPPVQTSDHCGGLANYEFDQLKFTKILEREDKRSWKRFKEAAASCFTFVETMGLTYAYKMICDAFGWHPTLQSPDPGRPDFTTHYDVEARADMAAGILSGLGLKENFAKTVLFCGHGCSTKNNPYASGLDCGACGGHAGDANARLAAALFNQEDVRAVLKARGIDIPDDTCFIAGLHNTTTDEVTLFDTDSADRAELALLKAALNEAGGLCAIERSALLGDAAKQSNIVKAVRERSEDWSQVRPEWGLAGNAGFIVAPRKWTKGSQLRSRAFLHEYNAATDPEGLVLEQIIGGPLVVGSWINLQYFGSATDNTHYGSGHKSIHNVVGGVGVALGNENDLRPGLPFQSVHDGEKLIHEPLRLHACIAAETSVLDAILERQEHVRHLVENGWVHLIALGADGRLWARRQSDGSWKQSARRTAAA